MDVKILIFLLIASVYLRKTYGYSCEYNECNCVGEMITCIDIAAPRFKFRPSVTKLYMENVQIVDIKKMLHNLPNLKYVTLVNINYFKCGWLENFATNVVVRTNMCDSEKESLFTSISTFDSQTDAPIPFSEVSEMETSQYKSMEDVTTKYDNTYHKHTEGKVTEYISLDSDSTYRHDQETTIDISLEKPSSTPDFGFHNSASKGFKSSDILNVIDNGGKEIKIKKKIIAFVVSVLFLLLVLIMISVILCRRKFLAWIRRGETVESDNSDQPLSQNMMEEISLENQG